MIKAVIKNKMKNGNVRWKKIPEGQGNKKNFFETAKKKKTKFKFSYFIKNKWI